MHSRESEEQNQDIREDKELVLVQLRKLKAQRTQARGIAQEKLRSKVDFNDLPKSGC